MRQKAVDFFIKNTNIKLEQIHQVKKIHHGFTNLSYVFVLKNKDKYQVRLAQNNDIVNRKNEYNFIKAIGEKSYIYIDDEGNAIKKWIMGKPPKFIFNKKLLLKLLMLEIKKIHEISVENNDILKHDYFVFFEKTKFINEIDKEIYLKLVDKYKTLKLTLSHNDINPNNIIYNSKNKKLFLIDFEWGRINNEYWDLANFFRETNLSLKWLEYMLSFFDGLKKDILLDFIYISLNYAYQWTQAMPESKKILKYQQFVFKKLNFYRKFISLKINE